MTPCEVCKSVVPLGDEAGERKSGPVQILIVEDDPLIGQDLTERLGGLGYGIAGVVASAGDAIALAHAQRPGLVLMDIQLSGEVDGVGAAEQIRNLRIPVVYVTGCTSEAVLGRAVQTGPGGYVLKPYETKDLQVAIQVALHKDQAESDRERLIMRLQEVLASIKTMTGRLSICAYCKKVKNSNGEWPEVEAYVMEHSHASFSHGMCPGCFARVKQQLQALEGAVGPE